MYANYFSTLSILFAASCALDATPVNAGPDSTAKLSNTSRPLLPVTVIHEFSRGTWVENIAVRGNGQILVTETTRPRIYQVDPLGVRQPILVHEFNDTASVTGIVETEHDIFYVSTGNLSSNFAESYGQAYIYEIDMRPFVPDDPSSARISKIASPPEAEALNGLTRLGDGKNLLLSADSLRGLIWSIDIRTGETAIAINNTLTQPNGSAVNGLKVLGRDVYFTNTVQNILAKVAVDLEGRPTGVTTVLAKGGFEPDDFALSLDGDAYVASASAAVDGVVRVPHEGGPAKLIAEIAGPTSCAFGRTSRDCHTLYVSTSGGDSAYIDGHGDSVAGKIVKLELNGDGQELYGCRSVPPET